MIKKFLLTFLITLATIVLTHFVCTLIIKQIPISTTIEQVLNNPSFFNNQKVILIGTYDYYQQRILLCYSDFSNCKKPDLSNEIVPSNSIYRINSNHGNAIGASQITNLDYGTTAKFYGRISLKPQKIECSSCGYNRTINIDVYKFEKP